MFESFPPKAAPSFEEIMVIASNSRIARIDKVMDMWDEILNDDEDYISLIGMMRYVEFLRDYPIQERHLFVRYDANGRIHLTGFFDNYKLTKLFGDDNIITGIIWGDFSASFKDEAWHGH